MKIIGLTLIKNEENKFKIKQLKEILIINEIAYKLSRNKFTILIFTLLTLIVM